MSDKKIDEFLQKNRPEAPDAPLNEYDMIKRKRREPASRADAIGGRWAAGLTIVIALIISVWWRRPTLMNFQAAKSAKKIERVLEATVSAADEAVAGAFTEAMNFDYEDDEEELVGDEWLVLADSL